MSVTKKITPPARSGRDSMGRARSPPANCVVSMHTPTFSMMSQTRLMSSILLMQNKPDHADRFLMDHRRGPNGGSALAIRHSACDRLAGYTEPVIEPVIARVRATRWLTRLPPLAPI